MLNVLAMMGRLTANPELRTTPNGVSVCAFTIAVERPHQKAGSDKKTDFFDCIAWRNNAEFVSRYFKKGSLICVQGYMTVRAYQDKNGNNRKAYEITVDSMHFTGEKRDQLQDAQQYAENAGISVTNRSEDIDCPVNDFQEIPGDGDLPF